MIVSYKNKRDIHYRLGLTMNCKYNFNELSVFVDNGCDDSKAKAISEHIKNCKNCGQKLAWLNTMKLSLSELPTISPSKNFDENFVFLLRERLIQGQKQNFFDSIQKFFAYIFDGLIRIFKPAQVIGIASVGILLTILIVFNYYLTPKPVYIEFSAGKAEIYTSASAEWIKASPNIRLRKGDKIKTGQQAIVNMVLSDDLKIRIKDNSLVYLSYQRRGWQRPKFLFMVEYGDILINAAQQTSSSVSIKSPGCGVDVIRGSFMMSVRKDNPNTTWLGVLEGEVDVLPIVHPLNNEGEKPVLTSVLSGQKVSVKRYEKPSRPELLSEKEWVLLQELYELIEIPGIILLIGTEPDRVDNLLKPASLCITDKSKSSVPGDIESAVNSIMDARARNSISDLEDAVKILEELLSKYADKNYVVELLMFAASYYYHIDDYNDSLRLFEKVLRDYPDSRFASLAQCAIATVYNNGINDNGKAMEAYDLLIKNYPNSIDAFRAKEALAR